MMQAVINDEANGITVCIAGPDEGYAPDIMNDLCARALDTYQSALIKRIVVANLETNKSDDE